MLPGCAGRPARPDSTRTASAGVRCGRGAGDHLRQASPVAERAAADLDGPLVGAADELDLERQLERVERREQVVGADDRPAAGLDDQVAGLDPGAAARLPSSTPRTRTPSRSGRPTDRRIRRATCDGATATPSRARFGDSPRPSASIRARSAVVGRERQVEALADPVRVEADQPAVGIDQRAAGRAGREGRGVLDAAGDPPAAGPRNARATAETRPNVTRVPPPWLAPAPKTAVPTARAAPSPHSSGGRAGGVDVDDREVAVAVPAGDRAARLPAVGERDGDLVAAQVVGVGQDLAGGDDDAGAAGAAADPDDGWADALGDGGDGGLEFLDDAHGM